MQFFDQLRKFNDMYALPNSATPNVAEVGDPVQRLMQFASIMRKELAEVDEIIAGIHAGRDTADTLADIGDWTADIMVYGGSEARRWGLPIQAILEAGVMESNFSKLGADGKPIYDNEMKVQKGPGYWKPEPRIKALIQAARGEEITPYVSYKDFMEAKAAAEADMKASDGVTVPTIATSGYIKTL